jgi:Fe-Mn family superoxide dismutase
LSFPQKLFSQVTTRISIGGNDMSSFGSYTARQFNLSNLKGISDQTLEMHFKLYEGYVKGNKQADRKISEFISDGNVDQEEMPAYSELTRRLGFEYNGMVLHEYYFDNLKSGGGIGRSGKEFAVC